MPGGSSADESVSSPVLTQTGASDNCEAAPGQQGGDTCLAALVTNVPPPAGAWFLLGG